MKISVITINYNNKAGLIKTMDSVLNQTYSDFEYIVIDGGSKDGSKELIKNHASKLSYWVSEPDRGIYNAMNKGIDQTKGDYLLFLNSGDSFNNKEVLKNFVLNKPSEDIVYGNTLVMHSETDIRLKIMPSKLEGMTIFYRTLNHQSVFLNKRIFEHGKRYNENYVMLADWVLYNEVVLIEKGNYRHIDLVIANYDAHGFSSRPENKSIMQEERNRFYASNIDFFIPHILLNYEALKNNNVAITPKVESKYFKSFVLFKKTLRMLIKGY